MRLSQVSPLQQARAAYEPKLPSVLRECGPCVAVKEGASTVSAGDHDAISVRFPHTYGKPVVTFAPGIRGNCSALKVGFIFSGGQAPGGHNVAAGLFDSIKAWHSDSSLYGFLGGPSGLIGNKFEVISAGKMDAYRNTGGFDMVGSGRTKLETTEQFRKVAETCIANGIGAVVIVGGDDSNTNACMLAEYMLAEGYGIQVIGCPKTIDGDLKNEQIEISFGFDTATRVYSELVGNIERDANSAKKYWHFIKLMGRSASHIALECALQTHPNYTIISEEVAAGNTTLAEIVADIAATVRDRAARKMDFGIVLVPEGLVEFIPEMKILIAELNELLADNVEAVNSLPTAEDRVAFVNSRLTPESSSAFCSLPMTIRTQLLMDRDPHGNVQVSRIETEKLLIEMVGDKLRDWKKDGSYIGNFSAQNHFFGYEGRCAAPSNFDADYCYSLGYTAGCLIAAGKSGYMASVRGLDKPATDWVAGGVPLTMMMNIERRKGKDVPVIRKALVELSGAPFCAFKACRDQWKNENCYVFPGPIQYFGPAEVADQSTLTLQLELSGK